MAFSLSEECQHSSEQQREDKKQSDDKTDGRVILGTICQFQENVDWQYQKSEYGEDVDNSHDDVSTGARVEGHSACFRVSLL